MGLRSPRVVLAATLLVAGTLVSAPAATAEDLDPLAPVVVDDDITLWPGQRGDINVLQNDTDPGGDELRVCLLPEGAATPTDSTISVEDESQYLGLPAGELKVVPGARVRGTHAIDYYVCSHTRLTAATLTVHVRPVAPVVVRAVPGHPGRLRVTNTNDRRILFMATSLSRCLVDAEGWVRPHASRRFVVHLRRVHWTAAIRAYPWGVADQGSLRDIEPAPAADDDTHVC